MTFLERKRNTKGFMLIETLIVCVFVGVVLVLLFVELRTIANNYEKSFTLNTTNALYNARKIKEYLQTMNMSQMEADVNGTQNGYIDITSCEKNYYTPIVGQEEAYQQYCTLLYQNTKVQKLLFSKEDLTDVQYYIEQNRTQDSISQKMLDFIDYIPYEKQAGFYRIIVEYKDGTFASIKIKGSDNA